MGRRKLEMKQIEDKSSRQVTFSKRRSGLFKKSQHLSVLCDVDITVIIFSARGKLYEFCSAGTNSVKHILSRYQKSCLEAEERTVKEARPSNDLSTRFRTCKELLQTVDRLIEDTNSEEFSVTGITQLEEELDAALVQTRSRKGVRVLGDNDIYSHTAWLLMKNLDSTIKSQLMMEYISTLQAEERKLSEEKEDIEMQVNLVSNFQLNNQ